MLFAHTVPKHKDKREISMLYVYIRQAVSGVVEGMSVSAVAVGSSSVVLGDSCK